MGSSRGAGAAGEAPSGNWLPNSLSLMSSCEPTWGGAKRVTYLLGSRVFVGSLDGTWEDNRGATFIQLYDSAFQECSSGCQDTLQSSSPASPGTRCCQLSAQGSSPQPTRPLFLRWVQKQHVILKFNYPLGFHTSRHLYIQMLFWWPDRHCISILVLVKGVRA